MNKHSSVLLVLTFSCLQLFAMQREQPAAQPTSKPAVKNSKFTRNKPAAKQKSLSTQVAEDLVIYVGKKTKSKTVLSLAPKRPTAICTRADIEEDPAKRKELLIKAALCDTHSLSLNQKAAAEETYKDAKNVAKNNFLASAVHFINGRETQATTCLRVYELQKELAKGLYKAVLKTKKQENNEVIDENELEKLTIIHFHNLDYEWNIQAFLEYLSELKIVLQTYDPKKYLPALLEITFTSLQVNMAWSFAKLDTGTIESRLAKRLMVDEIPAAVVERCKFLAEKFYGHLLAAKRFCSLVIRYQDTELTESECEEVMKKEFDDTYKDLIQKL